MHAVRAVIFDMDGTLADTEPLYRDAFIAAAASVGHRVRAAFHDSLIGLSSQDRRPLLCAEYGPGFPLDAFLAAYRARKASALAGAVPLCQGALPLLQALAAERVPCAIATSATAATAQAILSRAGLRSHLAAILTREDVPHGKPHPATHLAAARALATAPAQCLALEDSLPGLAAARAAGMITLRVGSAGLTLSAILALWRDRETVPA